MEDEQPSRSDMTKSYLPFATVISLVFFVAWSTNVVTQEKLEIDYKFAETARITKDLAKATADLAETLAHGQSMTWHQNDMSTWCSNQKVEYPLLKCPEADQPYAKILDSRRLTKTARELQELKEAEGLKKLEDATRAGDDKYDPKSK